MIQHNNNECGLYLYWTEYSGRKLRVNNTGILYLYLMEYSGRKVKLTNKCILYLYLTEYSGRKVDTTQQQWMCIVFVLDGIFQPESWYNTTMNVHSSSKPLFFEEFGLLLTNLGTDAVDRLLICGDFNLPGTSPDKIDSGLAELLESTSFTQLWILQPDTTRTISRHPCLTSSSHHHLQI